MALKKGGFIMAKKEALNPLTDKPQSLSDLTLNYMLGYIKAKGTEKDKKWYAQVVKSYWGKKYNNLAKAEIEGVTDIPALRRDFADRFFPNLLSKKREKAKKSYLDMVNELL